MVFFSFLFAAIAELLDNAVDEVIIPDELLNHMIFLINILAAIFFCYLQHTKLAIAD